MLGTLYIVGTPIGNLQDITYRALETLKGVDLIIAEDTRKTQILLKHYEIDRPTLSYHQQSPDSRREQILKELVMGKNLALVTDAGTPGVGDPGNELIDFLLRREPNISIITIPGPSSVATALSLCGFNVSKFTFVGFLPKKKRQKLFTQLKEAELPFVFFDSPYRIRKTLADLEEHFGKDARVFLGQELTKLHERSIRGNIEEARRALEVEAKQSGRVRGEIVGVVENG